MSDPAKAQLKAGRAQWQATIPPVGAVTFTAEIKAGVLNVVCALGGAPSRPAAPAGPPPAPSHAPPPPQVEAHGGGDHPEVYFADQSTICGVYPEGADLDGVAKMEALFKTMVGWKASDLHISADAPPKLRHDGDIKTIPGWPSLSAAETEHILWSIGPERNREEFKRRHDSDFAYQMPGFARYRCNWFMDRKGMGGVFRVIPSKIITAEEMGLSRELLQLCFLPKGLVLVTGPTGSGKSTTLCAMIDYINRNREDHIITIEDPLEFVHENKKCLINQRQVGEHTDGFKDALRAALREDPDIVLVGEMRDLETVAIAIETAETGHLVFGTLHTSSAPSTVDRIIDQFPSDRQSQIRIMLSESLKGVVSQMLCKKIGGGRVPALEILIGTPSIANLIREAKVFQIPSAMQTGKKYGMVLMNEVLLDLVKNKKIVEAQEAYTKAVNKADLLASFRKNGIDTSWAPQEQSPGGAQ
ncbi:MAG: type IV pilus twitching motility protein PilT [Vicinamibacteria bacterium]|nr:type IV pilus twitching motility protein PilT [Vicinamibacteria bacterium]